MAEPIRVLLADDHVLVLEGLSARLSDEPDIAVVGAVSQGGRVLAALAQHRPQVLVLDLHMAEQDGFQVLAQVRQEGLPVKVLILTAMTDGQTLQRALELEADGIVLKTDPARRVVEAIRAVAAGQVVYPQALHNWLLRRARQRPQPSRTDLTRRELEVLAVLAEGLTNQEIAARLHLSENTVKYHLQNIYDKLQVTNRTEAARKYLSQHRPSLGQV